MGLTVHSMLLLKVYSVGDSLPYYLITLMYSASSMIVLIWVMLLKEIRKPLLSYLYQDHDVCNDQIQSLE